MEILVPDYDNLVNVVKFAIIVRLFDEDAEDFVDQTFVCDIHVYDILLFDSFVDFVNQNFDIQSIIVEYLDNDSVLYEVSVYA